MSDRTDLATASSTTLQPATESASLLNFVAMAVKDPTIDVTKLDALLKMQREIVADESKALFNRALAQLLPRLPRIRKGGVIDTGKGKIAFAKWEDIDRVIRPVLLDHGFTLSFASRSGTPTVIVGKLLHSAGHAEVAEMALPADSGPGRNGLQAIGSSFSYAQRYIAKLLLNLVFEGEDDDGRRGGTVFIDPAQLTQLQDACTAAQVDVDAFCDWMRIDSLPMMPKADFARAMNAIAKRQQKAGEVKP